MLKGLNGFIIFADSRLAIDESRQIFNLSRRSQPPERKFNSHESNQAKHPRLMASSVPPSLQHFSGWDDGIEKSRYGRKMTVSLLDFPRSRRSAMKITERRRNAENRDANRDGFTLDLWDFRRGKIC